MRSFLFWKTVFRSPDHLRLVVPTQSCLYLRIPMNILQRPCPPEIYEFLAHRVVSLGSAFSVILFWIKGTPWQVMISELLTLFVDYLHKSCVMRNVDVVSPKKLNMITNNGVIFDFRRHKAHVKFACMMLFGISQTLPFLHLALSAPNYPKMIMIIFVIVFHVITPHWSY